MLVTRSFKFRLPLYASTRKWSEKIQDVPVQMAPAQTDYGPAYLFIRGTNVLEQIDLLNFLNYKQMKLIIGKH